MTAVDVLIVSYLSGEDALRARAAVAGPGVAVQLWDNSGELLAQGHPAISGSGENLFFAEPNQRLYAVSRAPYVLLLNPDVLLTHESLMRLVQHLEADAGLWAVAPRLLWPHGGNQGYVRRLPGAKALAAEMAPPLRRLFPRTWSSYRCLDLDLDVEQDVEQPPAACLLVRRSAVGPVLFDTGFPLFFNDVDLCLRMRGRGRCRYVASVTAVHTGGGSITASRDAGARTRRMYDDALLAYARRHLPRSGWLRAVAAVRRIALALRRTPGR